MNSIKLINGVDTGQGKHLIWIRKHLHKCSVHRVCHKTCAGCKWLEIRSGNQPQTDLRRWSTFASLTRNTHEHKFFSCHSNSRNIRQHNISKHVSIHICMRRIYAYLHLKTRYYPIAIFLVWNKYIYCRDDLADAFSLLTMQVSWMPFNVFH